MPPTTRSEQKAATRRRILEVAAAHFAAKGYAATSLNDLSAALGLTKGTIFFHFSSKAELARAISEDVAEQWVPLRAAHEERGTRGLAALVDASRQVATVYRESAVFRAASRLRLEAENVDADLPVPFVGWIDLARTYLAQAAADGESSRVSTSTRRRGTSSPGSTGCRRCRPTSRTWTTSRPGSRACRGSSCAPSHATRRVCSARGRTERRVTWRLGGHGATVDGPTDDEHGGLP